MNIYENYIETLLEDKPIGDKNKELWLEYLKKNYTKEDKDIFVTFVSEDKVGINPKSIWNTPNGIYAYPIKFILDDNKIPFRGSIKPKKIKVIKASSSKILDSGLTKQMYEKCLVVLKPKILEKIETYNENKKAVINTVEKFVKIAETQASTNSYFGKIWNITRLISKTTNDWSKMLISLGFDLVNDSGEGIIHDNEPTQAVFLNPKSYKVIGEEFVDTEERYVDKNKTLEFKDIRTELNKNKDDATKFLLNQHVKIIKNISRDFNSKIDFFKLLLKTISRDIFNFTDDEKDKILDTYSDFIIDILEDKKSLDVDFFYGMFPVDVVYISEYFHKQFSKILYNQLILSSELLLDNLTQKLSILHFPEVFIKLIKENKTDILSIVDNADSVNLLYDLDKKFFQDAFKQNPYKVSKKMSSIIKSVVSNK